MEDALSLVVKASWRAESEDMIYAAILLLQATASQGVTPTDQSPTIVVTARSTKATKAELEACLARKCPPKEDMAASIAYAENQFLDGDYDHARTTLLASRGRNKQFAATLPVEVADLSRANARLASLNGQPDMARVGAIETLDALKAGLPANDPRVLMQRLEVGDAFSQQGRIEGATQIYDDVARRAHKEHLSQVEGHALLRTAVLYGALSSVRPSYRGMARQAAERILASQDPAMANFRDGVILLRARLDGLDGKADAAETAIAAFRNRPTKQPMLVYAPAIDYQVPATGSSGVVTMRGDDKAQWVDVSFWVAPDGSVRDVDVLRKSANFGGQWLDPVLKALPKRRYAPLDLSPNDPGLVRIERYSLVTDAVSKTGSRVIDRAASGRIEMLDLTAPTRSAHDDKVRSKPVS